MKAIKYFLFCALLISNFTKFKAQDTVKYNGMRDLINSVCHTFKDNHPQISFFKYHLISPDGNIYDWYEGKKNGKDSINYMLSYLTAVKDLELSNFNENDTSVSIVKLEKNMLKHLQNGLTPISISFVEYEDFKDTTIQQNLIGFQNNQFIETRVQDYYPFVKKKFFMASALNHVIKIPQFNFYMDNSLIQSNIHNKIDSIYIDFGDSIGFRILELNNVYQINYATKGLKNCIVKLKSDTNFYYSTFQIYDSTQVNLQSNLNSSSNISSCNTPITPPDIGPIPINIVNGLTTVYGRYAIWYSKCNPAKQIRKPYIISAGFNPGNGKQLVPLALYPNDITINTNGTTISIPVTYGWRGTYYETYNGGYNKRYSPVEASQCGEGSSNTDQYLDRLRDEGYDVVILMFDDGTDYIQNNAALIEKLINQVNAQKYANGYYFENVVSGYSAGGVSTRLALANMEYKYKNGLGPHPHTKLWVSVETENQGANVPLGLQYLIDFQANSGTALPSIAGGVNSLQVSADGVNSIAASIAQSFNSNPTSKQLTLYTTVSPTGPTNERNTLMSTLNSIPGSLNGYPTFLRRVGVSQGSGINVNVPHTSNILFDSQLKWDLFGDSYTETDDCGDTYTVYRPVSVKKTTARWWSANNSQNIFDGNVYINANWTYMKRQCIKVDFDYGPVHIHTCNCIGPFIWSGQNATIADQHISKPTVTNNYDDAPSSTQSAHLELYGSSAYGFYNNWFAGNSYASKDPSLHGFAPTVSCLDIKDPNTGLPVTNFTSPFSLNLFLIRKNGFSFIPQSNNRYGYPYIYYPTNHYQITPYDAVFAIGNNNGTYSNGTTPKPNNQFHVEDPQTMMGDYLARVEVAPTELFMSNQTIGSGASAYAGYSNGYKAEFEARDKIIAGKTDDSGLNNIYSLYGNTNFLTPNGDLNVAIGSKAILHSGNLIDLLPGVEVPVGAELDAYIQVYNCADLLFRVNHNSPNANNNIEPKHNLPNLGFNYDQPLNKSDSKKINSFLLYPNPNNGSFTYVNVCDEPTSNLIISNLEGKTVYSGIIYNNSPLDLNLSQLANGLYIVKVINKNSTDNFKLNISK